MSNPLKVMTRDKKTGKRKLMSYASLIEAAEQNKIPYMTLYMRLRHGWPLSQALRVPVRRFSRRYVVHEMKNAA